MNTPFQIGISALISMTVICLALYLLSKKIKMGNTRFLSEAYIMMAFLLLPFVFIFLMIMIF